MSRSETSAVRSCSRPRAVLVVLLFGASARAHDVSDELTVGALASNQSRGSEPYLSDRLGVAGDASDTVTLSVDGTFTRYFKEKKLPAENIYQLAAAVDWEASEHVALGLDGRVSPPSTAVTRATSGAGASTADVLVRSRTSLLAAEASAEYDTAGDGPTESILDGALSLASYSTTQTARRAAAPAIRTKATPSALAQWRASVGFTEVLHDDTEAELSGSYYLYSTDPTGTGYFGASVFGRESVSDGLPLEPLRFAVRPAVRQRFGVVKLSAFFQYGRYVDSEGWNALAGVKSQVKVGADWKLWLAVNVQRDALASSEILWIPWGSVGARLAF